MNLRQKNKVLKRQIESLECLRVLTNMFRPVFVPTVRVEEYKAAIPISPHAPLYAFEAEILSLKSRVRDKLFEEISPNIEYKVTEQAVVGSLFVGKREKE